MGAPKGRPKPAGSGIKKGTPHKYSRACLVRDIVQEKLGKSIPERLLELSKLMPDREADILLDLMPYCHPKLAQIDMTAQAALLNETSGDSKVVDNLVTWFTNLNQIEQK